MISMIVVVSEDAVDFANAIEVGFIEPFLYKSKGFISSFLKKKRHRKNKSSLKDCHCILQENLLYLI
jgi:hypothetical protein